MVLNPYVGIIINSSPSVILLCILPFNNPLLFQTPLHAHPDWSGWTVAACVRRHVTIRSLNSVLWPAGLDAFAPRPLQSCTTAHASQGTAVPPLGKR